MDIKEAEGKEKREKGRGLVILTNKDWLEWQKKVVYEEYVKPELNKRKNETLRKKVFTFSSKKLSKKKTEV